MLRLRDRTHVGKTVNCPDCSEPIAIAADGPDGFRVAPSETVGTTAGHRRNQRPVRQHERRSDGIGWGRLLRQLTVPPVLRRAWNGLRSPVGVAWCVVTVCAGLLIAAAGPFRPNTPADRNVETADDRVGSGLVVAEERQKRDARPAGRPVVADAAMAGGVLVPDRLTHLGNSLTGHLDEEQHFPPGTVPAPGLAPDERLSWLAVLATTLPDAPAMEPLWDRTWRDPLNERFVRRRIAQFHNPELGELTGSDGYPASHFVGVAGVGEDAPLLSNGHPRAGVFGWDRRTRIEDIRDGTSNTIAIAGVQRDLGAWAAGGRATVRALTSEPYVNGPDGFGTGQPDSMSVLMADGSVRIVSNKTAPTVLRRMVAMADGLPLDTAVAGEPGDEASWNAMSLLAAAAQQDAATEVLADASEEKGAQESPRVAAAENPMDDGGGPAAGQPPAIDLPLPELKPLDVQAALAQQIVRFETTKRVPCTRLLAQLEDMAAVPIRYDRAAIGPDALETPVTLRLEKTTVGEILAAALDQAGLMFEIQADSIRVRRAGQAGPSGQM